MAAILTEPQQGYMTPPRHCALVTPDDATDLTYVARAISLTAEAAVKVTMLGGETVVIPSGALAAGVQHSGFFTRVWATGTGSTTVVAWW